MRIAMLAPISWPLPPGGYGPWEQVAYNLTEALVRLGHDVTLFAAGGTRSSAKVVTTVPHALSTWPEAERCRTTEFDPDTGHLEGPPDARVLEELHIAACMQRGAEGEFDVVHSHLHVHALVFGRLIRCPLVTTLHGSAWVRATHPILRAYRELPFVSLSDAERRMLPELNYVATVYNGIRIEQFPFEAQKDDYLLFAGRLSPEKGPDRAIEVAKKSGRRLLMAGMIELSTRSSSTPGCGPTSTVGRSSTWACCRSRSWRRTTRRRRRSSSRSTGASRSVSWPPRPRPAARR